MRKTILTMFILTAFIGSLLIMPCTFSEEVVTIRMVYWPGPEGEAISKIVEDWNRYYADQTGVRVEIVFFSREVFWEKQTSILLAGSSEIDIAFTSTYTIGQYAPYLEPLDEYFADKSLYPYTLDVYFESALNSLRYEGKLYGIPMDASLHVLIYRKDLIEKPPETFDELIELARKFTKKYNPDSPTEYGIGLHAKNILYSAMIWHSLLESAGGHIFENGFKPSLTTDAAKLAASLYRRLIEEGLAPAEALNWEYPQLNAAFQTGKVAMIIQWNAAIGELSDPEKSPLVWDKVGVAPIPGVKLPDGTVLHRSYVHVLSLSINKASHHKREAFKFLAYLTTTSAMLRYLLEGGFPPMRSVFVLPKAVEKRWEIPFISEILDKYSFPGLNIPEAFAIYNILAKHLSAAWSGAVSVDDALKAANDEIYSLLKEKGYYGS
ncbi:MAG TPA: sugar ABC transporter substrate-binding protein [Thermofilum sp.]|nr:sugar ABC transporter substrate-binding protein [Thermofilum sp.]